MKGKIKITHSAVLYWVILNLGTLLLAAGIYFFKNPNNFATGGVSGIAIILSKFTTKYVAWLDAAFLMQVLNVILLIIGFIFLGKGCTFKTAYCSLVYTAEMQLFKLIPLELPLTDSIFLEFIFAMLLSAAGSAIIFNCRASSGGTDIIALINKKYTRIKDVGTALLITDFFIAASTFFIFDIQTGLFSLLGLFTKAFVVDSVIESIGKSKYVQIITTKPELITPFILEGIHRGYTSVKAQGGYTGEERTLIITVCKRGEALKLKMRIHSADPQAFVILTDTNGIVGKGFRDTL